MHDVQGRTPKFHEKHHSKGFLEEEKRLEASYFGKEESKIPLCRLPISFRLGVRVPLRCTQDSSQHSLTSGTFRGFFPLFLPEKTAFPPLFSHFAKLSLAGVKGATQDPEAPEIEAWGMSWATFFVFCWDGFLLGCFFFVFFCFWDVFFSFWGVFFGFLVGFLVVVGVG